MRERGGLLERATSHVTDLTSERDLIVLINQSPRGLLNRANPVTTENSLVEARVSTNDMIILTNVTQSDDKGEMECNAVPRQTDS